MPDLGGASLTLSVGLFLAATLAILLVGSRLTAVADVLADRTGLGEAMTGTLFLGAATAMGGIVTSVSAAAVGNAEIAIGNAVGSLAAQTAALAVADAVYRRANLEHGAASLANVAQATLLIALLAVPLLAITGPEINLWMVHPATPLMIAGYIFGLRMISRIQSDPLWSAHQTPETQNEEPEEDDDDSSTGGLWLRLALFIPIVGAAGWVLARTGANIAGQTGLSATVVGGLFIALATSLPELVTSISAVRRGALALAVGGVIGGNAFDTLVVAFSDIAYTEGSIYHAVTQRQTFLIALTILLTGILLLGLLRRQERGVANIGFESASILILYVAAFLILFFSA